MVAVGVESQWNVVSVSDLRYNISSNDDDDNDDVVASGYVDCGYRIVS